MASNVASSEKDQEHARPLSSIEKGLDVFLAITTSDHPITAKALSRTAGINVNTVYHIIRTLRAKQLVERQTGGGYIAGPMALALGRDLYQQTGLSHQLSALLVGLRARTDETVYISTTKSGAIVLRECLESTQPLRVATLPPGYSDHPHARAAAKSVLAFLPANEVSHMFRHSNFEKLASNTITSYPELLEDLEATRVRGYAIDQEEFSDGVCCVSAPYFSSESRPVGSISISAPTLRFTENLQSLISNVRSFAKLATRESREGGE